MTDDNNKAGDRTRSTMWGGRFAEGPAALMERFNASLDQDIHLAEDDIEGSIAHAQMLGQVGIITAAEAAALVAGLEKVREEVRAGTFPWDEALEDVHMNVEHRLRHHVGDVAGKLHTGRSRNDQVATDIRLFCRRRLAHIGEAVRGVQAAFVRQASGHERTVMPGFTHLQIAQPISYGFYCLAWVEMFERDRDRLASAAARLNHSPLGAAALGGTPHPVDRQQTAEALAFDGPMANALDAVSARDFILDVLAALAICGNTISRYAEDVVVYATPQFGYLKIGDAYTTGSSIMPQKRNPDAAELLRAKVGMLNGAFQSVSIVTKGVGLAYAKDLQETKMPLIEALAALEEALVVLAAMVDTTSPVPEAMARDASAGFATATDLADALVKEGTAFRDAHHIVGALVAKAEALGVTLDQVPLADAQATSPLITQNKLSGLTPLASIEAKRSAGSTHPDEVTRLLQRWEQALANSDA